MNILKKILNFGSNHRILSGFIIIVLILTGYFWHKAATNTAGQVHYALAAVEKGTIISSVSGTGQVSVSDQLDIKPKISGDVIYVAVKNGQEVWPGSLIAQVNTSDAQKAVRDAQINLENAQVSLLKLKLNQGADSPKLQNSITNAQNNLDQAYQSGFNEVGNSFLDLPNILTGIRGILYDTTVGSYGQTNTGAYQNLMDQNGVLQLIAMINKSQTDYLDSSSKYTPNLDDYKNATRYSEPAQIISLIDKTLETAKTMAQTVKDEQNILDAVVSSLKQYQSSRPIPQTITQYQSDISGYIGKLNGHINSLANIQSSITSNQQALNNAKIAFDMAEQSNPLDIISQENTVKQREAALQDAQDNLAKCYIRTPFAGMIAKLNVKRGDSVSNGTAIATLLTKQNIAGVTLNEVDISKIKVGQKVTLTFDAVEGLTLTGKVSDVDSLGTVSQGVVTYNVQIGFDTQDDRVKPGMSVSAAIITDTKQDALIVPNSAIKSVGGTSYVQIPSDTATAEKLLADAANSAGILLASKPQQQVIEVGLSNDSVTEIINGLNEGDLVITRTITQSVTTQAKTTQSLIPGTGTGARGSAGGNANFRASTGR
jgi:RND family efflux transporter MFP subunit